MDSAEDWAAMSEDVEETLGGAAADSVPGPSQLSQSDFFSFSQPESAPSSQPASQASQPTSQTSQPATSQAKAQLYLQRHFKSEFTSLFRRALAEFEKDPVLNMRSALFGATQIGQASSVLGDFAATQRIALKLYPTLGLPIWECIASSRSPDLRRKASTATGHFHGFLVGEGAVAAEELLLRLLGEENLLCLEDAARSLFCSALFRRIFQQTLLTKAISSKGTLLDELSTDCEAVSSTDEAIAYVGGYSLAVVRRQSMQRAGDPDWDEVALVLSHLFVRDPTQSGLPQPVVDFFATKSRGSLLTPTLRAFQLFRRFETDVQGSEGADVLSDQFWLQQTGKAKTALSEIIDSLDLGLSSSEAVNLLATSMTVAFRKVYVKGLSRRLNEVASRSKTSKMGQGSRPLRTQMQDETSSSSTAFDSLMMDY